MPRRYLLVKVVCDKPLSNEQFGEALANSVRKYFGEIGFSRIDPRLVRFDSDTSTGIVSCQSNGVAELESAVALISEYLETPVTSLVVGVSGTIKGLRKGKSR